MQAGRELCVCVCVNVCMCVCVLCTLTHTVPCPVGVGAAEPCEPFIQSHQHCHPQQVGLPWVLMYSVVSVELVKLI